MLGKHSTDELYPHLLLCLHACMHAFIHACVHCCKQHLMQPRRPPTCSVAKGDLELTPGLLASTSPVKGCRAYTTVVYSIRGGVEVVGVGKKMEPKLRHAKQTAPTESQPQPSIHSFYNINRTFSVV